MNMKPIPKHIDERGFLIEFLREDEGVLNFKGQIYASTLSPNDIRGNHYHNYKTEIFCVIKGIVSVWLQHIETKNVTQFALDSMKNDIDRLMVEPKYAHAFKNIGKEEAIILAYGDKIHDHENPDQHLFNIEIK